MLFKFKKKKNRKKEGVNIPGACPTRDFAYLVRGPLCNQVYCNMLHHILRMVERQCHQGFILKHKVNIKNSWKMKKSVIDKWKCNPVNLKFKCNGSTISDGNRLLIIFFFVNLDHLKPMISRPLSDALLNRSGSKCQKITYACSDRRWNI